MNRNYISLIAIASLILISCGGKNKATLLIPKDASVAVKFNATSLGNKLSWNDIKGSELYKIFETEITDKDLTPAQKSILDNPENLGIDLGSDIYIFYEIKGNYGYTVFQGKLKEPKKFETNISELAKDKKISKSGNINYAGDDEICLTWTQDHFLLVGTTPAPGSFNKFSYDDEAQMPSLNTDSLMQYAKRIYGLSKSASLSSDSRFSNLLKDAGDIHFFINSNAFAPKEMGILGMTKAGSFVKDNATGMAMSFDNGKVTINSKSWYGKELTGFMKKFQPKNFDASMLNKIPSENVAGMLAINYPPEGIKEFFKLMGMDGLLNMFTAKLGVSLDDFVIANKGDMMIAVTDFAVKEKSTTINIGDGEPHTFKSTGPDANILFATAVKDKAAFTKLIDVVKGELSKEEDGKMAMQEIKYAFSDNWFVLGNQQSTVDAFATANTTTSHSLTSQITGHPMGGFIDFQKIATGIPIAKSDTTEGVAKAEEKMILSLTNNWENIIFYGGEMKDNATTTHFEINLKDKNTNSLKQLFNFLSKAAAEKMKEERNFEREFNNVDSANVLPVVPVDTPKLK